MRGAALSALVMLGGLAACTTEERPAVGTYSIDLSEAVALEEVPKNGVGIVLSSTAQEIPIDRKSKILIRLDQTKLRDIASRVTGTSVLPDETPAEREDRERARKMLEVVAAVVSEVLLLDSEVAVYRAKPEDPKKREQLRATFAAVGRRGKKMVEIAKEAATVELGRRAAAANVRLEKADGEFVDPRAQELWFAIGDELFPNGKLIDMDALARCLAVSLEPVKARALESQRIGAQTGNVKVRVRAQHLKAGAARPLPIHCANYDSIEQDGLSEAKPGWLPSARDRELFTKRWELVKKWSDLINKVKDDRARLGDEIEQFKGVIRDEAKALVGDLESLASRQWADEDFAQLVSFSVTAGKLTAPDIATLRSGIKAVRVLVSDARAVRDEVRAIVSAVDDASVVVLATRLADTKRLAELGDKLRNVPKHLAAIRAAWIVATKDPIPDDMPEIHFEVDALNALAAAIDRVEKRLPTLVPNLIRLLSEVGLSVRAVNDARRLPDASQPPDGSVDPETLLRTLDKVVNSEFTLAGLDADKGDQVRLYIELLSPEPVKEGKHEILAGSPHTFDVERYGLSTSLDAHVIFVRRIHEQSGTSNDFKAAPSASLTLHWKFREGKAGDDSAGATARKVYNFFDPGIGIGVAALNLDNNGPEVGAGAHASILHDLVQFGVGFNLNVSKDREYYYVGIGLFEALDIAGAGFKELRGRIGADK